MTRRLVAAIGVAMMALSMVASAQPAAAAGDLASEPIDRVLVLSLPAVSWEDMQRTDTPNLDALFADSALGDLITRVGGGRFSVGNGYVSFGAGNRAVGSDRLVGAAYDVDEEVAGGTAGEVFARRTGEVVSDGLVQLNVEPILSANADATFDGTIGALADALAAGDITQAVIGNADGAEAVTGADPDAGIERPAVAGLMDARGTVPAGQVDESLLEAAPRFPFGVRLDPDRVVDAFTDVWSANTVVLVEASDQLRALRAVPFTSTTQARGDRLRALRHFDVIVGRLLDQVDPARDAVVVISPMSAPTSGDLAIAAVRAPGVDRGLLRSATTRRTGFVNLVDMAPTVLDLLGIDRPDEMEGREVSVEPPAGAVDARVSWLARASRDGVFRDNQQGAAAAVVVGLAALLALGTGIVVARGLGRAARAAVRFSALSLIGFLAATYAAGPLHFAHNGGRTMFWVFLVVFGLGFGAICTLAGRRSVADALLVALGVTVAVHAVDLVTGQRLELSTVFGYSPTVGIRVAGEGNLTFAQLSAATILLAGLIAWRISRPIGRAIALSLLAVILVIMVSPTWGQDFGAVSAVVGFALLGWLLLGRPVRRSTVVGLGATLIGAALVVGFIDLIRPADRQTHIGRFFAQVGDDGIAGFLSVVQRKASENLASFQGTVFVWMLPIALGLALYLWWYRPGLILSLRRRISTSAATFGAFALTALLGYALNDSGVAVPAMMFIIGEATAAYLIIGEAAHTTGAVGLGPNRAAVRRELWRGGRPGGVTEPVGEPDPVG